jgi:hypothetical protein
VGTIEPTTQQAEKFREGLIDKRLSRSSVNNYSFTLQLYHGMLRTHLKFPPLRMGDKLPFFFNEDDILSIFYCTNNIKYLACIKRPGGLHVFCWHSSATLMLKNG